MPSRRSKNGKNPNAAQKEQLLVDLDSPASKHSSLPSSMPEDAPIYDLQPTVTERGAGFDRFAGTEALDLNASGELSEPFTRALDALQFEPSPVAERMGGSPWAVEEDSIGAVGHTRSPIIAP